MFQGTGTALVTPFNEDLHVDYKALTGLVTYQIVNKADALIVLGTTGESPTVDIDERRKILDHVVQQAGGRIPVIAGTGTNDTKDVIRLNKIAEETNADGLLIVNPYYNKGTQNGIIEHFSYISERTVLPIILYNVPSRTGMNMLPDTMLKIAAQCKNVVGIKEAGGDISAIAQLIAGAPESLKIYSGNDDQIIPIMSLGGIGVISVLSNLLPKEISAVTAAMLSNNYHAARALFNKYLHLMNLMFVESNPIPIKYALSLAGLCQNVLRLPLTRLSQPASAVLRSELERLGH